MTFINPISGAALPAAQAQERLAVDKARQLGRQQVARRVTAASAADRFEHVVENAEPVSPAQDERRRDRQRQQQQDQQQQQNQHQHERQDDGPQRERRRASDRADERVGPDSAPPTLDVRG